MYQGIEISEVSLVLICVGFTFYLLVHLTLFVFVLASLRRGNSKVLPLKIAALVVLVAIVIGVLFICVIPGWSDYLKKDYIVYEGSFEVSRFGGDRKIIFDDGKSLKGSFGLDKGEYKGKIVYSKRTGTILGVSK